MLNDYSEVMEILIKKVGHPVNLFYDTINGYVDSCWCGGKDEIGVGVYTDKDLEALGFFHECGHILNDRWYRDPDSTRYSNEKYCWRLGLTFAREVGWLFPYSKVKWCIENQLNSYIGYEEWYR